jgi:hypothetical protein
MITSHEPNRARNPLQPVTGQLTPYFAARWLCAQCGKFLTGGRTPPKSASKCPHCGRPTLLDAACHGLTVRSLPFADRPHGNVFGKVERPYWQQQPARRIHRKGGKRRKGEKDRLSGYDRDTSFDSELMS